jgi:hypothetical protein
VSRLSPWLKQPPEQHVRLLLVSLKTAVLVAFLIIVLGLSPSLLSLWLMRQADAQAQARLQIAMTSVANRQLPALQLPPDRHYVEGLGYIIGDITCQFNARSSYIRCAVNPSGPCDECLHYQPRPLEGE